MFDSTVVAAMKPPNHPARPDEVGSFLARLQDETAADVPFYYESNRLSAELTLRAPPALAALLPGLRERGFRAARTHARPEGFRTDAPRSVVESVTRALSETS